MNREDVIRMAREAGIGLAEGIGGMPEFLKRFAALVAAAEREACCKAIYEIDDGKAMEYLDCQEAIRARGSHET